MGAVVVVSVQPVGRHVTHFLQAAEDVAVEHLGWVGLVESFDIGVLRGLPPNRRSDRVSTAWRSPPLLRTGVKRSLHARSTAADIKASGYGRFGGQAGIEAFTELRWITVHIAPRHYPF